uniref:G-protein coupled receptors family 1 profile domain-containing protein n=1 Tax=Anolis carolinensis TaxID=28377 RepID=A0A803TL73_ANOCA|nr:PREDICTED: C-X-C chemokine receptor type 3-like [Anolis carolinensis]|eukprot:XP_003229345.2 PREDICTED: C-X-C chemokine receptor type 3-like [Anolis carolinensis]
MTTTFSWGLDYINFEFPSDLPDINPGAFPCTQSEVGSFARSFGPAVFSVSFLLGLVGNGLVLAVLSSRRCPWLLADRFLFQLAVADLLLVLVLPFRATQFSQSWAFGEPFCKLVGALSAMSSYSTAFLLACVTLERYLAIVHSLQPRWTPHGALLASTLLWAASIALSVVELHFRTVSYVSQAGAVVCHLGFDARDANTWRLSLRLVSFLLGFLFPVAVMVYCYVRMLVKLRQLFFRVMALRLLSVILLLFVLCWGPFHGFVLVDSLQRLGHVGRDCAKEKILDFGLLFTESVGLVHSCLNPLVYAFVGAKFRKELSGLFRDWRQCRRQQQIAPSPVGSGRETEFSVAQMADYSVMM